MTARLVALSFDAKDPPPAGPLLGGRPGLGDGVFRGGLRAADPEGNEFGVVEPGNNFLADCGFIGALSSDGTQQVGKNRLHFDLAPPPDVINKPSSTVCSP